MEAESEPVEAGPTPIDALVQDLQRRRAEAGNPSFSELVLRIDRQRQARGVPPEQARPARTTVYDAFRTGRRRINTALVLEIVAALGADEAEVARWAERCRALHLEPAVGVAAEPATAPVAEPDSEPDAEAAVGVPRETWRPSRRLKVALLVGCLALNLIGRMLVDFLGLAIYLDMIGTAVSAVLLGPWWGALVGVSTNLAGVATSGWPSVPFALVNVAGALVWGYGVHRLAFGRTIPRFFLLNVVVAVTCSVVAVPIIVILFGGAVGHGADRVTATFREIGEGLLPAVASSNLLTSLVDKMIAGFVALTALELARGAAGGSGTANGG